jgi:hypothetical protein
MNELWQHWLGSREASGWMHALSKKACKWNAPTPALRDRIENIGHLKGRLPSNEQITAAALYLGKSVNSVSKAMDMQWLAVNKAKPSARRKIAKSGWLNSSLRLTRKTDAVPA